MDNKIVEILNKICIEENKKLNKDGNAKFKYEVLQLSDLSNDKIEAAYLVSKFYNENFKGNADFMHIPDFMQTMDSIFNYPIIIAREEGSKKILGISVLKYYDSNKSFDPYFPVNDSKYFSVTGILTNLNNKEMGYYGIGKKIYEINLKGVLEYKKNCEDIRLMCVIDCRNNNSINALKCATNNLNSSYEKEKIRSEIVGYYTVQDFKNKNLIEAPTYVIEMKMNNLLELSERKLNIKYDNDTYDKFELYDKMKEKIDETFPSDYENNPIQSIDPECGVVNYYNFIGNLSLDTICIDSNSTEKGNNRIPFSNKLFNLKIKKTFLKMLQDNFEISNQEKSKELVKKYV